MLLLLVGAAACSLAELLLHDETFDAGPLAFLPAFLVLLALVFLIDTRRVVVRRLAQADAAEVQRVALLQSDPLTGALSRRVFMDHLRSASHRATTGRPCALLLIELDHFKSLNDTYGHNVGDFALRHLAEVARQTLPHATIGRLGGDEFAILLEGQGADIATVLVADFLEALRRPKLAAQRQLVLGASIGIAVAPVHTDYFEELMLLADLALYESKRQGRGRATVFNSDMLRVQRHRRNIERDLRAAILLDELELHYQPIAAASGAVAGVEALVRWRHPLRGTIAPGEFIPVAEDSTLIDLLGEWVLRRALRDLPGLPGRTVSVNVSAAQFRRDDVVDMVLRTLRETGTRPGELVLEITENVALSATPGTLGRIQALRNAGVRFALDDFGAGHCGFNYLHNLPVDIVKIDRAYVARLGEDPVSEVFVKAVVETARLLKLAIVAEGIETEAQHALARAVGCSLFQGYLLGRPQALTGASATVLPEAAAAETVAPGEGTPAPAPRLAAPIAA